MFYLLKNNLIAIIKAIVVGIIIINSNTKIECKGGINNIEQLGDVSLDIIKIKLDKNTINNEIPVATYFMSSNGD